MMPAKIELLEPNSSHASFFFELMNSKGYLKNIGDRGVHSVKLAEEYIEQKIIPGRSSIWGYRLIQAGEQLVGIVGILNRPNLPGPDLGFALLPQFERKGLARAASIKLLSEYALACKSDLSLPQFMSGITNIDNSGSQNVLLALGFSFDQRLPWNGERVDVYRRAMKDFSSGEMLPTRCYRCFVDPCICDSKSLGCESIELLMISHCEELKRYSSTGRVAVRALSQSYLIEQGRLQAKKDYDSLSCIETLIEEKVEHVAIILSADPDARPIDEFKTVIKKRSNPRESLEFDAVPSNIVAQEPLPTPHEKSKILLIAVDGSWRQASKLTRKLAKRFGLTKVGFKTLELTREHVDVIRQEHFENGRSTIQAVAEAYYQLGERDVGEELLKVYQKKLAEAVRRRANI